MKKDISIHFTIKAQSLEVINQKLSDYFSQNQESLAFDFSEAYANGDRCVLHHCFLPRRVVESNGFDSGLVDSLDELGGENQVCWHYASDDLGMSRVMMIENLYRLNGLAVFVGDIKEGVESEYHLALERGVETLHIQ